LIENEDDEGMEDGEDHGVTDEGDDEGKEDMMWQVCYFFCKKGFSLCLLGYLW
jgi:hypothetical protein